MGDWEKEIEIQKRAARKKKIFWAGPTRIAKAGQKSLVPT
jgi:hypothetical protein